MARLIESTPALNEKQYTKFLNNVFSNESKKASRKNVEAGKILYRKIKCNPMFS